MSGKIIVGLSGKKRAGKDFACGVMRSRGWEDAIDVHRLAFADALKAELAAACGVTVQFIEENKDAFRTGLQWFGTEFRRELFGDDYWLVKASSALEEIHSPVVVVPDVRFTNEAEWVKSYGGVMVRINRTAGLLPVEDTHASETDLDDYDFDYVLENDLTEKFRNEVEGLWVSVILQQVHESATTV